MRALVTGASGGIGKAAALRLAADGYDVILHCFRGDCEKTAAQIVAGGKRAYICRADLSSPRGVEELADFTLELGGADVLVNNAGVSATGLFQCIDADEARKLFEVNTLSPIGLAQRLLPTMLRNGGAVINISSIWGVYGASCEVHYSASKAALIGFTKALAQELEPSGVTVNCIAPGFVETPMNAHLSSEEKQAFLASTPLGRAVTPGEIAEAVSLFAADRTRTGEVLLME